MLTNGDNDTGRTRVEGATDRGGVVGFDANQPDRSTGGIDGGEAGDHPGVPDEAVLQVECDVVPTDVGEPLGGDRAIQHRPVAQDALAPPQAIGEFVRCHDGSRSYRL